MLVLTDTQRHQPQKGPPQMTETTKTETAKTRIHLPPGYFVLALTKGGHVALNAAHVVSITPTKDGLTAVRVSGRDTPYYSITDLGELSDTLTNAEASRIGFQARVSRAVWQADLDAPAPDAPQEPSYPEAPSIRDAMERKIADHKRDHR